MFKIYLCVCACLCGYPSKPEEGIGFHGAGVTDNCELPDVDTGNSAVASRRITSTL